MKRWMPSQWPADAAGRRNMALLIQLRWIAIIGQTATILVVHYLMGIRLPLAPMLIVPCLAITLNWVGLLLLMRREDITHAELFLALWFDVLLLTTQLYLSGGITNPFIAIYLLQVALAATLLHRRSVWGIVFITTTCAGFLTRFYQPLPFEDSYLNAYIDLRVTGSWLCLTMIAVLLVLFMTRINRNLAQREAYLAQLRQRAVEEEHIVRMGLLASGAAHELGTPLSSIAVVLGDWRRMPEIAEHPVLAEEVEEMEAAVKRCKAIVTGVLQSAGEARGESPRITEVRSFFGGIAVDWRMNNPDITLRCDFGPHDYPPIIADPVIRQAICNLLDNAREASATAINLIIGRESQTLNIAVCDNGNGFSEGMLLDFGKPYRSTKGKQGGGLGLFLVVNVVRKLGGNVTAGNSADNGAMVVVRLPLSTLGI